MVLEPHLTARDYRETCLNRNWDPLNLDVRYPELFPDRLCHQLTQFESKTGGLTFVVFERKRRCVGAVGDPDSFVIDNRLQATVRRNWCLCRRACERSKKRKREYCKTQHRHAPNVVVRSFFIEFNLAKQRCVVPSAGSTASHVYRGHGMARTFLGRKNRRPIRGSYIIATQGVSARGLAVGASTKLS